MISDDLDILFDRLLDGVAEPEERDRCESLLKSEPGVRERYVQACQLRQSLADRFTTDEIDDRTQPAPASKTGQYARVAIGALATLAAMVTLALVLLPDEQRPRPVTVDRQEESFGVARIARKINCVLSDETWAVESSAKIRPGQTVGLERGFMSLVYDNGVTVALEGPVEFTVVDSLHGVLELGGIGVRVPDGFSGFIVDTPTARVTDLGTEFSVRVGDRGNTDLRVIEGEVTVSGRNRNGELVDSEPALLKQDAVWNSVAGLRVPQGPPSKADFPSVSLLKDPPFGNVAPLPATEDLLLRLRADLATKTDSQGRIIAWGDISTQAIGQRHSGWQVEGRRRPALVSDGIAGKPTIRFDGLDDCLLTEPFDTGNQQTVAVVARLNELRGKRNSHPAQQILNYNGPPHLVLEYRWPAKALRGRAYDLSGSKESHSGRVRARPISAGETLAIVYVYDHENDRSALYLNGEKQGQAKATLPIASSRPKVIGLHRRLRNGGLLGDVSEMVIYDRAISAGEVKSLFDYLEDRYGPFDGGTIAQNSEP